MVPSAVAEAIEAVGLDEPVLGGTLTVHGHHCEGAKEHDPQPLIVRKVLLDPGETGRGPIAELCGTCTDHLLILKALLMENHGNLPEPVFGEFDFRLGVLAQKGWQHHVEVTRG